jgi:hypothetical protein
MYNHSAV